MQAINLRVDKWGTDIKSMLHWNLCILAFIEFVIDARTDCTTVLGRTGKKKNDLIKQVVQILQKNNN